MKVVQLNTVCYGSTGTICATICDLLEKENIESVLFHTAGSSSRPTMRRYMCRWEVRLQVLLSRISGNYGFNSRAATRRLLKQLDAISPDVVHLHNIHGHDCHLGMLFHWLKEKHIRVFWTFHDCWAFTGYCPHFMAEGCEKWKTGCENCPKRRKYSWFFDRSDVLYRRKKSLFTDLDLTIICPSQWMADLVRQSFLKDCPIKLINNGIDLSVFRPCPGKFRKAHGLENKCIILGVASGWNNKKGLDTFLELASRLDEEYVCVLVGTDERVDKLLPKNVVSIHKTKNRQELAEIYSDADVFFNPTKEDTYPTVNMEAIACGTPVVTYRTGGSPETVSEKTGMVVDHDLSAAIAAIDQVLANADSMRRSCVEAAAVFDQNDRFREYVSLYTSENTL